MFPNSINCSLKTHKSLSLIFFLITSRSFLNQSIAVVIAAFCYSTFSFSPVIHFTTVTSTTATQKQVLKINMAEEDALAPPLSNRTHRLSGPVVYGVPSAFKKDL
jgi:hypothetical protein